MKESFAMELLHDMKKQNKRIFAIWIITFVALVCLCCYTIYLLNDIGTESISEETTYDIENDTGNNNFIGGDINGYNENN